MTSNAFLPSSQLKHSRGCQRLAYLQEQIRTYFSQVRNQVQVEKDLEGIHTVMDNFDGISGAHGSVQNVSCDGLTGLVLLRVRSGIQKAISILLELLRVSYQDKICTRDQQWFPYPCMNTSLLYQTTHPYICRWVDAPTWTLPQIFSGTKMWGSGNGISMSNQFLLLVQHHELSVRSETGHAG